MTQAPTYPDDPDRTAAAARLRLLGTTDLHAHLLPYDYFRDRESDAVGLVRTASLIAEARAEVENCLLFDSGDVLQGSPMGDLFAEPGRIGPDRPHPMIAAMNRLGYDAATPGNHDFNYGIDFLRRAFSGARFPVVASNAALRLGATPGRDRTLLPARALLTREIRDEAGVARQLRIGVLGLAPPQIAQWDRAHLAGRLAMRDIIEAAQAHVAALRRAGAEVVVALCHSGLGPRARQPGMENAAIPLAALPGLDAIFAGHSHLLFPDGRPGPCPIVDGVNGRIHGTATVMAGHSGSHLGVIDLVLRRDRRGRWRVAAGEAHTRAIATRDQTGRVRARVASDPELTRAAAAAHAATLEHVRRPVGRLEVPLDSYLALVADDPALQLIADAQRAEVARALAGRPEAALPLLSAVAPFRAGGRGGPENYTELAAGEICLRHVADLYSFPNSLRAVRMMGAALREWLERSAALFCRLTPGAQDQPLLDPGFPSYNFDVISGLSYRIDLTQPARYDAAGRLLDPAARRIRALRCGDRPVGDADSFVVATNSYRVEGGSLPLGTGAEPGAEVILETPLSNREVLLRHIIAEGRLSPRARGTWALAPMPGTTALFRSSPRAALDRDRLRALRIEPTGELREGFAIYRLHL